MKKHATPGTYTPGASRVRDEWGMPVFTDKGEPVWNLPKPVGVHETLQVVRVVDKSDPDRPKLKKVKQKTKFPVYRGLDASLARYLRAQMRRAARKAKEKKSAPTAAPAG